MGLLSADFFSRVAGRFLPFSHGLPLPLLLPGVRIGGFLLGSQRKNCITGLRRGLRRRHAPAGDCRFSPTVNRLARPEGNITANTHKIRLCGVSAAAVNQTQTLIRAESLTFSGSAHRLHFFSCFSVGFTVVFCHADICYFRQLEHTVIPARHNKPATCHRR